MRRAALAAAFALSAPAFATAQVPSAEVAARAAAARVAPSLQGRPVLDAKGDVIGTVERVAPGPDGRPAQILVRPKGLRAGGPRSLELRSVTLTEKGLRTPLTRSEFEAMPAVRPDAN